VIEAEIKTEEEENPQSDRLVEPAVEVHRLVDPIAVAEVPDEAGEIGESCTLTDAERFSAAVVRGKCPQEWSKRDPAEGGSPGRHRACERKRQNLQNAGEYSQSPELSGDESHGLESIIGGRRRTRSIMEQALWNT
jgi:hypothetical protein